MLDELHTKFEGNPPCGYPPTLRLDQVRVFWPANFVGQARDLESRFLEKIKLLENCTDNIYRMRYFPRRSGEVCVADFSGAVWWTGFVTPRALWPQQGQTNPFSYYMKGESEQAN